MRTILVVADEPDAIPRAAALRDIAPDIVVSCGDLPFDVLEGIVDVCNVPLLYVPGNHDPRIKEQSLSLAPPFAMPSADSSSGPRGGQNIDGRVQEVAGVRVAGLGGSIRYRRGPNQYTQRQMRMRCLRLEVAERVRRRHVDVLLTHSPPLDVGDDDDPAHRGFAAFHRLIRVLKPRYHVHGHIHPHGRRPPQQVVGDTTIVNAVGYRVLSLDVADAPESSRR